MTGFLILGPLSKDIIIKDGIISHSLGGAVYYQSKVFSALEVDHTVLVTLSREDEDLLNQFPESTHLNPVFKGETVCFENKYLNNNLDHRIQRSNAPELPLKRDDLNSISKNEFEGIILSPLLPGDIPLDTVKYLHKLKKPLYLGAQGYLRDFNGYKVKLRPRTDFERFIKGIKIVFMDKNELRALRETKYESLVDIARRLSSYGLEEVVITCAHQGSLIYSEDKLYKIKAYHPSKVVDPTGLGDTYLAAYLSCRRKSRDIIKCGEFAARLATLKLENKGFSENLSILNNIFF